MKLLLLALCATIALSTRVPSHEEWLDEIIEERYIDLEDDPEWKVGTEYQFLYNGQLTSGIPGTSSQYSATRVQALVAFARKSQDVGIFKMTHIRFGKLNQELKSPRAMIPIQAYEEIEITEEQREVLTKPVLFKFNKGLLVELKIDEMDEPWSTNLKRGVLNMVQLNMHKHRVTSKAEESRLLRETEAPEKLRPYEHFSAMEQTLEGDCEVHYTVTSEPTDFRLARNTPVLNITKSINFEKCQKRPDIRYNLRFSSFCPGCDRRYEDQEKFLESSTVARYNITGNADKYTIQSARVESEYTYTPYSEQGNVLITYVNQTLELVHISKSIRVNEPNGNREYSLMYSLEWDIEKEDFLMEGKVPTNEKNFLYGKSVEKEELVSKVISTLAKNLHKMKESVPEYFTRLVVVLRNMKLTELEKVFQKYYVRSQEFPQEQQKQIKELLIDALAIAGTKDTTQLLVKEIKSKKIGAIRGAVAIKSLVGTRVVSEAIIEKLYELAKSNVAQEYPVLKQSAYLTVGSLIGALCRANDDKLAKEIRETPEQLCPISLKEKYVQYFEDDFQEAKTVYEKILIVKMITNAGLDLSVYPLEKIIKNSRYPVIVRQQAVEALRKLRDIMPRKVQSILMPVYMNHYELPELRMIAFSQLMQTLPPRPIIDQITEKLFTERSKHVAAFVYSYLTTLKQSTNPCEKRLAEDISLSLRNGRRVPFFLLPYLSRYFHRDMYSQSYKAGLKVDMGVIKTNTSYLPKDIAFNLHTFSMGYWQRNAATIGLMQVNTEDLITRVFSYARNTPFETLIRRSPRDIVKSPDQMLKNLFKQMKISERKYVENEMSKPMALLYLRYKDEEYGLLPVSYESIPEYLKELVQDGSVDFATIEKYLEEGYNFNQNVALYASDFSRTIPTSVGMPLQLSVKAPVVVSVKGKAKAVIEPEGTIRKVEAHLFGNVHVVSSYITTLSIWNPVVSTGVKVVAESRLHLPVDTKVIFNSESTPTDLKVIFSAPKNPVRLLNIHTRPVTFTRVWPKEQIDRWVEPEIKTIYSDKFDRINRDTTELGELATGVKLTVRRQWYRTPIMRLAETPICLLSGPNKLEIIAEPGYEAPEKIELKLTGGLSEILKSEMHTPLLLKKLYKSSERFFNSEEDNSFEDEEEPSNSFRFRDDESEEDMESYVNDYETKDPKKSFLKLVLKTLGGSVTRKLEMIVQEKCDMMGKHCQFEAQIERTPIPELESENWKMIANAEIIYPETPYSLNELKGKKVLKTIKAEWGPESNIRQQYVDIKIEGERSREQERLLRSEPYSQLYEQNPEYRYRNRELFSPVSQFEYVARAASVTQFKVRADYQLSVAAKNVTNTLYRAIKYFYFPNTDVAQFQVDNPEGQILAQVNICPKTFKYVNVTALLPNENVTMLDIPSPMPLYNFNLRRSQPLRLQSLMPTLRNSYYGSMAQCKVQSRRIQTFDNVEYRVPLTTCYSVISKDCSNSEDPKFAVMVKKLSPETEQKKLKILTTDSVIEVYPTKDMEDSFEEEYSRQEIEVKINGEPVEIETGDYIQKYETVIKKYGEQLSIYLREAGVKVYFDGYTVSVKVNPSYQNIHCGLCGDYDLEQEDEYVLPNREVAENVRDFHRAYLNEDEECELDDELLENEEEYEYSPLRDEFSYRRYPFDSFESASYEQEYNEIDSEEEETLMTRKYTMKPKKVTKVIEHHGEICFSKFPVAQCPKLYYGREFNAEVEVPFACVSRRDPTAETLRLKLIDYSTLETSELAQLTNSFKTTVEVPRTCERL